MKYTLGMNPTISIRNCNGDLKIEAHDGETISLFVDDEEYGLSDVQTNDTTLTIGDVNDDLLLMLPYGATVSIQEVNSDVMARGINSLHIERVNGDCMLDNIDTFNSESVEGDLKATQTRELILRRVEGDVRADKLVELIEIDRIEGDVMVANSEAVVHLKNVNGDLLIDQVSGKLTANRVAGDVVLRGALPGFDNLVVNGDAKFGITWQPDNDYRATINGDAILEIPSDANVTLSGVVYGDVRGATLHENQTVSAVWGDGAARIELTVHGDLIVRGAGQHNQSHSHHWGRNWGMGDDMSGALRELTEELADMGRDIAAQFTDMSREWRVGGSERAAERVRQASDRVAARAAAAAERMSVRINDREIRVDPERLERIKEQARRAADEGIARAQEAIDRAMSGLERNLNNVGAPRAPRAPRPPMPPMPPMPPRAPQRINITDNDGSSSVGAVQSPATGQTVNLKEDAAFAVGQQDTPQSEADKTQERLAILKMVQAGKISADEAALLLDALG